MASLNIQAQLLSAVLFLVLSTLAALALLLHYSSHDNSALAALPGNLAELPASGAPLWQQVAPPDAVPQLAYSAVLHSAVEQITAPGAALYAVRQGGVSPLERSWSAGQLLWQRDATTARPTASMAKLMSLLLVQEILQRQGVNVEELRRVPSLAAATERPFDAAVAGLKAGEWHSWAKLLSYSIIISANDAIYALAILAEREVAREGQQLGETEALARFVARMNRRATALGLESAQFVDPDGWSEDDLISPLDMAHLAAYYVHSFPQALAWHRQQEVEVLGRRKRNTNLLLAHYPEIDGLKTGFTYEAGFNFTAELRRGDWRLIAVLMGIRANDVTRGLKRRAAEAEALLDWGLRNFAPLSAAVPSPQLELEDEPPVSAQGSSELQPASLNNVWRAVQRRLLPQLRRHLQWLPPFGMRQAGLRAAGQTEPAAAARMSGFTQLHWHGYWPELSLLEAGGTAKRWETDYTACKAYGELRGSRDADGREGAGSQLLMRFAWLPGEQPQLRPGAALLLRLRKLLAPALWPLLQQLYPAARDRCPFACLELDFAML